MRIKNILCVRRIISMYFVLKLCTRLLVCINTVSMLCPMNIDNLKLNLYKYIHHTQTVPNRNWSLFSFFHIYFISIFYIAR